MLDHANCEKKAASTAVATLFRYPRNAPLVRQMSRLAEQDIPVFIVRGNHDAQSTVTKSLSLPANVVEFESGAAHSVRVEGLDVAILRVAPGRAHAEAGRPFFFRAGGLGQH